MRTREALISLKTFSGRGVAGLSSAIENLAQKVEIIKISSVFKVSRKAESFMSIAMEDGEEELEGYSVVVSVKLDKPIVHLASLMEEMERELSDQVTRRVVSINVLAVKDEILKTPQLTIPHPEFHLRPEELIPACELWPDYEHPILRQPITEIAKTLPNKTWGEFHCQGQSLLAKPSP